MRTLILLIALLLLALQTQAEPLGRAEEVQDQEQLGEDDQDMSISLGGDGSTALQDADVRSGVTCYCRTGGCRFPERLVGTCRGINRVYRFCCRR